MIRARDNPLRTERLHALAHRPMGWDWPALLAKLRETSFRGAIVGPQGSGKTTLMQALNEWFVQQAIPTCSIFLNDLEQAILPAVEHQIRAAPQAVVLLDGAEQLSRLKWRRFSACTRHHRGLIITTHTPGLLPTLVQCTTTVELLNELLRELLPEEILASLGEFPGELFHLHHGNIRLVLLELYDVIANGDVRAAVGEGPPPEGTG